MIDVSEVLLDPDLCESFQIERSTGTLGSGGWKVNIPPAVLNAYGAVRNMSGEELESIPAADRVNEMISIRSTTTMFVTSADQSATSDVIIWKNDRYRVVSTKDYGSQGYSYAVAGRMAGN